MNLLYTLNNTRFFSILYFTSKKMIRFFINYWYGPSHVRKHYHKIICIYKQRVNILGKDRELLSLLF